MRKPVIAIALLLLLSGCATVQPMDAITEAPILYDCSGDKGFSVVFPTSGKRAQVSAGGLSKSLPLAQSGSGARYVSGAYEYWGKGDTATLSGFPDGPYTGCRTH